MWRVFCVPSWLKSVACSPHFRFSSHALNYSSEQQIRVVSLIDSLCRQLNMLSQPKSHWQGPTSANGIGHTTTTRATNAQQSKANRLPGVSGPSLRLCAATPTSTSSARDLWPSLSFLEYTGHYEPLNTFKLISMQCPKAWGLQSQREWSLHSQKGCYNLLSPLLDPCSWNSLQSYQYNTQNKLHSLSWSSSLTWEHIAENVQK